MNVFIARQPIFDKVQRVVAYELLFRSGGGSTYDSANGDEATLNVIADALLLFGLDRLTGRKRAFVNFTEKLLKGEVLSSIPKEMITVEILETVAPSQEIINTCKRLKKAGYQIALDDFIFQPGYAPLFEYVDIIKVDFRQTEGQDRRRVIEKIAAPHITYLAEKVETREEFQEALDYGYSYFQGYFFSKPETLSRRDIPSKKNYYFQVINEVNRPDLDFGKLEAIINRDVAFSYKLLKFINSSSFGFMSAIKSIRQALVLIGQKDLVRWITLLSLREYGLDKPSEIIRLSVVRAKFGELLALKTQNREQSWDIFFLGMFSLIDALTDRPLAEILSELPIDEGIKNALLDEADQTPLRDFYQLILSYEQGDWDGLATFLAKLRIVEGDVPAAYVKAIEWADTLI
ncbi:MAG: EAL domain-containing protein [Negativicutes bacterium]|nr:EAL domain-containing protein [Negativicutes bacterium]